MMCVLRSPAGVRLSESCYALRHPRRPLARFGIALKQGVSEWLPVIRTVRAVEYHLCPFPSSERHSVYCTVSSRTVEPSQANRRKAVQRTLSLPCISASQSTAQVHAGGDWVDR